MKFLSQFAHFSCQNLFGQRAVSANLFAFWMYGKNVFALRKKLFLRSSNLEKRVADLCGGRAALCLFGFLLICLCLLALLALFVCFYDF